MNKNTIIVLLNLFNRAFLCSGEKSFAGLLLLVQYHCCCLSKSSWCQMRNASKGQDWRSKHTESRIQTIFSVYSVSPNVYAWTTFNMGFQNTIQRSFTERVNRTFVIRTHILSVFTFVRIFCSGWIGRREDIIDHWWRFLCCPLLRCWENIKCGYGLLLSQSHFCVKIIEAWRVETCVACHLQMSQLRLTVTWLHSSGSQSRGYTCTRLLHTWSQKPSPQSWPCWWPLTPWWWPGVTRPWPWPGSTGPEQHNSPLTKSAKEKIFRQWNNN